MPLSLLVRLRGGSYDAGGDRPSESEWPPHPARVFCALAASAESDADWSALRWLEQQDPPQVWADPASRVHSERARAYVVQNAVREGGGNLMWPGRTNGLRTRAFVVPSRDVFAIVWPQADPSAETLSRLNFLAWKVPYIGRSTSSAQVSALNVLPPDMTEAAVYRPAEFGIRGQLWDLRIPYPGYTAALRGAYLDGRRSWEVARSRPYVATPEEHGGEGVAGETGVISGPFADMLIWGIERPAARVGGDLVVSLASALRRAVLSRVPDPVPGQVSGHTAPGRPHVAFLVLPDVAHRHADGHALGLALAVPREMPDQDLTILLRALLIGDGLAEVRFSAGRPLALGHGVDRAGLRASAWTSDGGKYEWVTVTPMMLDGHTRRGRDVGSEVARSLVIAGYPEPTEVEVSAAPLVAGGVWRPRKGSLPAGRPRRQMIHARVRFAQPVIGPVLAGSMRYLGLGLFRPAAGSSQQSGRPTLAEQGALAGGGGIKAREQAGAMS